MMTADGGLTSTRCYEYAETRRRSIRRLGLNSCVAEDVRTSVASTAALRNQGQEQERRKNHDVHGCLHDVRAAGCKSD